MLRSQLPLFLSVLLFPTLAASPVWQAPGSAPSNAAPPPAQASALERLKMEAVDLDDADAQFQLFLHYTISLEPDKQLAIKWLKKSAVQGHPYAQLNLGIRYRDGDGVPKDYTQAASWFRRAAA